MTINIYQNGSRLVVGKVVIPAVSQDKKLQKFFNEVSAVLAGNSSRQSTNGSLKNIVQKNQTAGILPPNDAAFWRGR